MLAPNDLNAMLRAIRAAPDPVGAFADLIERFAKNELTLGPGVGMSIPMLRGAAQKLGGDRMRVELERSLSVSPLHHAEEMEKMRADYGRPDWIGKREFYINARWRESANRIMDYLFTHVVFTRALGDADVQQLAAYIAAASHLDRAPSLPAKEHLGIHRPGVALMKELLERIDNNEIFVPPGTDLRPLAKLCQDLGCPELSQLFS